MRVPMSCRHCGSPELRKYGSAPNGKQKYRCRTCGRQSRDNPGSAAYSEQRKEEILRAYQERSSLRGLERTFGVARSTVISWLKKSPQPTIIDTNISTLLSKFIPVLERYHDASQSTVLHIGNQNELR